MWLLDDYGNKSRKVTSDKERENQEWVIGVRPNQTQDSRDGFLHESLINSIYLRTAAVFKSVAAFESGSKTA